MKRIISMAVVVMFLGSILAGCASTTGEKTGIGATLGALAGAILCNGNAKCIAAGAAIGGLTGYLIGKYEEKQVQTREQVYREYPEYSKRSTAAEPAIKDLKPELMDMNNNPIESFTAGQTIKMASEYTIVASPEVKNVEVEENNYLVMPDGTRTPDAVRTKPRDVQRVVAKQTLTLPKELVAGRYAHVATVKIGDEVTEKVQTFEIASLNHGIKQYALKSALK